MRPSPPNRLTLPAILLALNSVILAPSLAAQKEVAKLVSRLNVANGTQRNTAYQALYRGKPREAMALLQRQLPDFEIYGQDLGLKLLERYPAKEAVPVLRKLANSSSPYLQCGAATLLYRAGFKDYNKIITRNLWHPSADDRSRAAMIRRLAGIDDPKIQAAIRDLLIPKIGFSVLNMVLEHLRKTDDAPASKTVKRLLDAKETSGSARLICLAFLFARGDTEMIEALAQAIAKAKAVHSNVWKLFKTGPKPDKQLLAGIATHAEKTTSQASLGLALPILLKHDPKTAIPLLRKLMVHNKPEIAEVAYATLAATPGTLKMKQLREMLASEEPRLSLFAAETLCRRDDPSGLKKVLTLAGKPGKHRYRAVQILSGFRLDESVATMIDALADNDRKVRQQAFAGLDAILRSLFPYRRFDLNTTGYTLDAAAPARKLAIAKLHAWWKEHRPKGH